MHKKYIVRLTDEERQTCIDVMKKLSIARSITVQRYCFRCLVPNSRPIFFACLNFRN